MLVRCGKIMMTIFNKMLSVLHVSHQNGTFWEIFWKKLFFLDIFETQNLTLKKFDDNYIF